jgi:predicted DCC family thiol-disulfide oxidoreductase YuxK
MQRDYVSAHIVTQVYFDGGCPVCRREIAWYQGRRALSPIEWVDVSASVCDPAGDLCRVEALRVFHVRCSDGRLVHGARAFALLWQRFPGLRSVGWVAAMPGVHHALGVGYRLFLWVRRGWRPATTPGVE